MLVLWEIEYLRYNIVTFYISFKSFSAQQATKV